MQKTLSSLPTETREVLHWTTESLRELYGSRLRHLILFGSYAREEARSESDVDLLVVLEGPIRSHEEAKRTSQVAIRAAAYRDTALSFVHLSEENFEDDRRPLVRSAKEEGIDLLEALFSDSPSPSEDSVRQSR